MVLKETLNQSRVSGTPDTHRNFSFIFTKMEITPLYIVLQQESAQHPRWTTRNGYKEENAERLQTRPALHACNRKRETWPSVAPVTSVTMTDSGPGPTRFASDKVGRKVRTYPPRPPPHVEQMPFLPPLPPPPALPASSPEPDCWPQANSHGPSP